MFYRRSGVGPIMITICRARLFSKFSSFNPFTAFPPSPLKRSRCSSFVAFANVRVTRFSMNMFFNSTRLNITLNIRRLGDNFCIFGVVLFPEKTLRLENSMVMHEIGEFNGNAFFYLCTYIYIFQLGTVQIKCQLKIHQIESIHYVETLCDISRAKNILPI